LFLPTTKEELKNLGWDFVDIILVTGDSYIDSPFIGVSVIGKVLVDAGYRVAIIAQPDLKSEDIARLGEPRLFWSVTGGCIDSMVANRTAIGRKRKSDDYTPGGENNRRPDRAVIAYTNLIKKYFKSNRPIVLGGIEASLRRIAHYDFWSDKIRKSVLFDSKADYLLYGMAERSILELADSLKHGRDTKLIRGLCYISRNVPDGCLTLPSYEESAQDKKAFIRMFHDFYNNNDPKTAMPLAQKHGERYLIQNTPQKYLSTAELDKVYALKYERDQHPFYQKQGSVKCLDTIRFSILTHRGCYGECNFCSIAVHQGQTVRRRSKKSIVSEAREFLSHPMFKGIIQDVGGATANMYGIECAKKQRQGSCSDKRCLFPDVCSVLKINHDKQLDLLRELRQIEGVRKVFVASGIRHDMILADEKNGTNYLKELVRHHISGQMKIAPEHSESSILKYMGKPKKNTLVKFRQLFNRLVKEDGKKQFLTYYLIAAHPGCSQSDMISLKDFVVKELGFLPKQVQVFTPLPSTYSALMYWTEEDPFSGEKIFVEKTFRGREQQKDVIVNHRPHANNRSSKRKNSSRKTN